MIRRNFVDLSDDERNALAAAFNHVNDNGLIEIHAKSHDEFFSRGIHWRPQFLPWHRYFLRKLELALQEFDPDVMLPYWDWTQNGSQDLDRKELNGEDSSWKKIFGGRDNNGGKFDNWDYDRNKCGDWITVYTILPTMDQILTELDKTTFTDYRKIEGPNNGNMGSHVHAHPWVGGKMGGGTSPLDPLFYLHHCNLDRLWSIWQINNSQADQYNSDDKIDSDRGAPEDVPYVKIDGNMPEVKDPWQNVPGFSGATPRQMRDHRKLGFFSPESGYTYPQDNVLEAAWQAKLGTSIITHTTPLPQVDPQIV